MQKNTISILIITLICFLHANLLRAQEAHINQVMLELEIPKETRAIAVGQGDSTFFLLSSVNFLNERLQRIGEWRMEPCALDPAFMRLALISDYTYDETRNSMHTHCIFPADWSKRNAKNDEGDSNTAYNPNQKKHNHTRNRISISEARGDDPDSVELDNRVAHDHHITREGRISYDYTYVDRRSYACVVRTVSSTMELAPFIYLLMEKVDTAYRANRQREESDTLFVINHSTGDTIRGNVSEITERHYYRMPKPAHVMLQETVFHYDSLRQLDTVIIAETEDIHRQLPDPRMKKMLTQAITPIKKEQVIAGRKIKGYIRKQEKSRKTPRGKYRTDIYCLKTPSTAFWREDLQYRYDRKLGWVEIGATVFSRVDGFYRPASGYKAGLGQILYFYDNEGNLSRIDIYQGNKLLDRRMWDYTYAPIEEPTPEEEVAEEAETEETATEAETTETATEAETTETTEITETASEAPTTDTK